MIKTRRQYPESALQKAVIAYLRIRAKPHVIYFHVPQGGRMRPQRGALLKALGVRAGVADIILFHNCLAYCLELKAPSGRMSPDQETFAADCKAAGVAYTVAYSLDAALAALKGWGMLRTP
jgi:hypothetical protein